METTDWHLPSLCPRRPERRAGRWDQPCQGWRGFNLLQSSPAQSDNFPCCASPGSSGRISLSRGGWGADGQRTLKFCLLAVAGALLHYNYTAWTSFIMAGLHSPPCCSGRTLSHSDTDTKQAQSGSGNKYLVRIEKFSIGEREREVLHYIMTNYLEIMWDFGKLLTFDQPHNWSFLSLGATGRHYNCHYRVTTVSQ